MSGLTGDGSHIRLTATMQLNLWCKWRDGNNDVLQIIGYGLTCSNIPCRLQNVGMKLCCAVSMFVWTAADAAPNWAKSGRRRPSQSQNTHDYLSSIQAPVNLNLKHRRNLTQLGVDFFSTSAKIKKKIALGLNYKTRVGLAVTHPEI